MDFEGEGNIFFPGDSLVISFVVSIKSNVIERKGLFISATPFFFFE